MPKPQMSQGVMWQRLPADSDALMEPSPAILVGQDISCCVDEKTVSKNSEGHMNILCEMTLLPQGKTPSKLVLNAPSFCWTPDFSVWTLIAFP